MESKLEEIELDDLENENEKIIDNLGEPLKKKLTPFVRNIIHVILIVILLLIGIILLVTVESRIKSNYDRAIRIHSKSPFIDASNSLPYLIFDKFNGNISIVNETKLELPYNISVTPAYAKEAVISGMIWTIHDPCDQNRTDAQFLRSALSQIDIAQRLVSSETSLEMIQDFDSTKNVINRNKGVTTFVSLGIRGGHFISNDLGVLRIYKKLGASYFSLVDSCSTRWAETSNPYNTINTHVKNITKFGIEIINEMNKIGMIIDVGYLSSKAQLQVLSITQAPVITTLSGVYNISKLHRNLNDSFLLRLKENNGIVFIPLSPPAICNDAAQLYELYLSKEIDHDELLNRYNSISNNCTIKNVIEHIIYIKDLIGTDHIGISTSFDDGSMLKINGLESMDKLPYLTSELLENNFSNEDIKKIIGNNVLRLWKEVEDVSNEINNNT